MNGHARRFLLGHLSLLRRCVYAVVLRAFFLRAKSSPERPTPSRNSELGSGTAVEAENVEVPEFCEVNTKLPSVVAKQAVQLPSSGLNRDAAVIGPMFVVRS